MGINLADKGYFEVYAIMPGEFSQLPPGGYICQIVNAELTNSKAGNTMLVLFLDIAHGDFKGHFKAAVDRVKFSSSNIKWDNSAIYRQLLLDNSSGRVSQFFKGLLSCFEVSNPNFKVNVNDFEASSLRGKFIGFIFAQEEYQKKNGDIATRVFPKFPKSIDDIQNNNFTVPELKKLPATQPTDKKPNYSDYDFGGSSVDPNDTPF